LNLFPCGSLPDAACALTSMTKIIFQNARDERVSIDATDGTSVMHAAVSHGVDGIVAECGGSAMCATCHVYVDPAFAGLLPPPDAVEDEMLNSTADERRPNSRLSCQLVVRKELEGLLVVLPEHQT
jgi:2Fe-2S ferredoxin